MNREKRGDRRERKNSMQGSDSMGDRGVTRPMMEMDGDKEGTQLHGDPGDEHTGHHKGMTPEQRLQMLQMHHMQTLWVYWALVMLGVWMIMSPLTFDYGRNPAVPGGGREVWLGLADRITAMRWSDIISGALLVIFGWRSLTPNRPISLWICCFVGIWLSAAPIIFWSPSAAAYLNDTLVGAMVISLTVLIPGMPNMIMFMKMGSEVPQGWSYNPSSWPQRWIMIVTGFVGWIVSRYLAAFQLGYIDTVWDPFFGESSIAVLNSSMSHSLPVSDAGIGALAYTLEFLMGFMGSPSRWRTMPWMVALFGILVIPLGLVHIVLVISQPLMVGAWCTLCILAAAIMLPMIPLEADEVIAMGQHMVQAKRKGQKLWDVFWKGGKPVEMNEDKRSPELMQLPDSWEVVKASLWGFSVPWTLALSTILGVVVVAMPGIMGISIKATSADIFHLAGALIVVVSVACMGEVLRTGRYLNIALGLAVAAMPWFVPDSSLVLNVVGLIGGLAVAALAIPRGVKRDSYGMWDRYVR